MTDLVIVNRTDLPIVSSQGDTPGDATIPIVNPLGPAPAVENMSQMAATAAAASAPTAPAGGPDARLVIPDSNKVALYVAGGVVLGIAIFIAWRKLG